MSEKRDNGPIILGIVLLFFLLMCVVISITMSNLGRGMSRKSFSSFKTLSTDGNVGLIKINGAIMKSENKVKNINKFAKNDKLKAIILYINSPGGSVGSTEEIYRALIHAKEKGKNIYVVMGGLCASGGYFISSAADEIFTENTTLTASIGVIIQMTNLKELYKFLKMDVNTFKSGKYKDIGNPARDMTKEERDYIQKLVDDTHQIFLNIVIKGRSEKIKKLHPELKTESDVKKYIEKYAQGQIILGNEAVKLGFADQIGDMQDCIKFIEKELKIKVKIVREPKKHKWSFLLENIGEGVTKLKNSVTEEFRLLYMM
jgi:protease-4